MLRVLVPIEAKVRPQLAAIYFALEFAKRHPARIYFLLLSTPGFSPAGKQGGGLEEAGLLEQLLDQARRQRLEVEVLETSDSYLPAVARVARQYGIDDIVVALPPSADPDYRHQQRRLERLQHLVSCNILTVKPKPGTPADPSWRSPPTGESG